MIDSHKNDTVLPKDAAPVRKQWHQNKTWIFVLFNLAFVSAFFSLLRDLVSAALRSEYDTYIPFIPFISAYLIYLDRQKIFATKKYSSVIGLITLCIGVLLLFFARSQTGMPGHRDYLSIMTLSMVTLWIGGFAFCYGVGTLRSALFPLLFLFFMVPVPGAVLEKIIFFLQTGSAEISYMFFQAAGIPVARDGFIFHLPALDVEVAKQCSGIRSSLALIITGCLAAYLFLRTGWARIVLMISLLPVAIIKNGLRIFTLTTLGAYWDARILDSDLHRKGGFVFFAIALVLVGAVIVLLRKMEKRPENIRENGS